MFNSSYDKENRQYVIGGAVILLVVIFIARLFYLQVVESDYKAWADSNAFLKKTLYPSRGMMYDRNGKLLVYNQPAYDVMLIMREIQPFDTTDLCNILGITKVQFVKRMTDIKNPRMNPGYSSYVPQVFMKSWIWERNQPCKSTAPIAFTAKPVISKIHHRTSLG